ncbi:MAG: glucosidase [Planctomycetes bacterium]|nr:glucosidase [Planctomycetota bacterium]
MNNLNTSEHLRLEATTKRKSDWKHWGPYLSDRAWGTVREDYSPNGTAWDYFPHDHARSRAYRWNEDGLGGICDRMQHVCFALAMWNGKDPIIKERYFGLTGSEGNHGEDCKDYYWYLDSTPTHSYMKMLYKYPQAEFPYSQLLDQNRGRGFIAEEFELCDTGIFDGQRYFDVFVEYAKAGEKDILIQITVHNRGPEAAAIELLPTLWFRNTWSWGLPNVTKPHMSAKSATEIEANHEEVGTYFLFCDGKPELLFCENESNAKRLWGSENGTPYPKDGINDHVVRGEPTVNPERTGTKAAARYKLEIGAGQSKQIRLRLRHGHLDKPFQQFDELWDKRVKEADEFYETVQPRQLTEDERRVQRQAFGGLLWSKQWFHYDVDQWLAGDPAGPTPPAERKVGRNRHWQHMHCADVISMPDKWEYPWFAAWDLAFHTVPIALVDPEFAKRQLVLMLREWYMHPNGQIPAYEWAFGDVNPPVHAWACWRVYKMEKKLTGKGDVGFLERCFHKLLLNFTWWVNRKDASGNNIFQGGFLGMDNIGVFDRSQPLPTGGHLEQSDSTAWMGMYSLNLMVMAMELAKGNPAYEDVATKFFEHFLYIAHAMANMGEAGIELWDEEDGFFYDVLHLPGNNYSKLKIRSMVGLVPLFAVETIEPEVLERLPRFRRRMEWFLENRPDMSNLVSKWDEPGQGHRYLLSLLRGHKMKLLLKRTLDESEFFSDYGIRALSKYHEKNPYIFWVGNQEYRVDYWPAESRSGLFGGNSNWRGPIWFPVNYLILESLQKFHHYYGEDFKVECPAGSGNKQTLWDISMELGRRLTRTFLKDRDGKRPLYGEHPIFKDPHWRDHVLFYEYFHGDNGRGIGATHQTGWTAIVAKLIQQAGEHRASQPVAGGRRRTDSLTVVLTHRDPTLSKKEFIEMKKGAEPVAKPEPAKPEAGSKKKGDKK